MGRSGKGEWGLKLLSLLMAVVLWIYVSNDQNPTKVQEFRSVPVDVRGLAPNLAVSQAPGDVTVRVQADQNIIANLNSGAIEAFVDLSLAKGGKSVIPVQVKAPAGVKVVDLRPQEVNVVLEPLGEKQVPVIVRTLHDPGHGYKVSSVKITPDEVVLRGPKRILDRIDVAGVEIELKNRTSPFGESLPVRLSNGTARYMQDGVVKSSPDVVDVLVSIVPDLPSKTVGVVPNITGVPAKGFAVTMTSIDPASLIVTGDQKVLDGVTRLTTKPIDVSGVKEDISTNADIEVPPGIVPNRQSLKVLVKIGRR